MILCISNDAQVIWNFLSQICLDLLRQIARWHMVGWRFVPVGDPDGQHIGRNRSHDVLQ